MRARAAAYLERLLRIPEADLDRIVALGFCFGGAVALELARSGANLAGVVNLHGGLDTLHPGDGANIKGRVLALHGALDQMVPEAEVGRIQKETKDAEKDWRMQLFGRAAHSFTNSLAGSDPLMGSAYDEPSAARAWAAINGFPEEVVGGKESIGPESQLAEAGIYGQNNKEIRMSGIGIITGKESKQGLDPKIAALADFYAGFNNRDVEAVFRNWADSDDIVMDNPIGGIKRGKSEIRSVYERIFGGPAKVYVEFYDFTMIPSAEMFCVTGRERGTFAVRDISIELAIRTSRIFKSFDGVWRQVHHHGSMDNPALLEKYQKAVLG